MNDTATAEVVNHVCDVEAITSRSTLDFGGRLPGEPLGPEPVGNRVFLESAHLDHRHAVASPQPVDLALAVIRVR